MLRKLTIAISILLINLGALTISSCTNNSISTKVIIQSANYLNPSIQGKPEPIVVTLYLLNSKNYFQRANYTQLTQNSNNFLGSLIDKKSIEIRPKKTIKVNLRMVNNARYLGVVANYRKINTSQWRRLIKIPKKYPKIRLSVYLDSNGIKLRLSHKHGMNL